MSRSWVFIILLLFLQALPSGLQAAAGQFVTGQAAVAVVGQKNFSENIPGAAAHELGTVTGLAVAGDRLIVVDGGFPFAVPSNNRVLIFDGLSGLMLGATASVVIGQSGFDKADAGLSEKALKRPVGVATDGQRLIVADADNNRVLIFNRIPSSNGAAADLVVGQPDFKTNEPDTNQTKMRGPSGVFTDGGRLLVADTANHRVLIYSSLPGSNGARADVVLGQSDFNARADQPASAASLRDPTSVFYDGVRLIVTDLGHNRVLIYNRLPTGNNAAADVVVGQPDFTKDAAGTGPASLNFPRYASTDGTRLFIADTGNNRVLVYNQVPTANGAAADSVLGQKDFVTATDPQSQDPGRLSAGLLDLPVALAAGPDSSVLVADSNGRRVLKFVPGVQMFTPGSMLSAANFGGNGLSRVTNVQVEIQPEGKLPAGTYYIKATAEGGILFESAPSDEIPVTIPENSKLIVTFDEVPGATTYRVYLGGSPGGQNRYYTTEIPDSEQPINRRVEISELSAATMGAPRLEVTPGSIAALFGQDLAPRIAVASQFPLPRELAGVRLLVNGLQAPLFFVSPTQINFQVPWEVTGSSASVVIEKSTPSGFVASAAVPVSLSDLTPGVFTTTGDGIGRLLAFHPNGSQVTDENPLVAGEEIVFYGTGVQTVRLLGAELAGAVLDTRARGQVSVTPDGVVTWSTSFVAGARLYVSIDGGEPSLLAEATNGTFSADFIAPGHVYEFILRAYVDGTPGEVLATATLNTRNGSNGGSGVSVASRSGTASQPSGQISVTPEGSATWSTTELSAARVYLSVDGGWETLFAEGASGTKAVESGFIQPGHVYRFVLRVPGETPGVASGDPSPPLVQVDTTISLSIQGRDAPIRFAGLAPGFAGLFQFNAKVADDLLLEGDVAEVKLFIGSIPANLTYVPIHDAATGQITADRDGNIAWSTSQVGGVRVYVSIDGGEPSLLAEAKEGTLKVDFIDTGYVYQFILKKFVGGVEGKILATATVDTRS